MDPDMARRLLVQGATLIVHGLPQGSEFGIDLNCWHTGPKFRGLKMIPPGIHIFYYNIVSKYGDVAPRTSFIHDFKRSEIVVKRWNPDTEELLSEDLSEEEVLRVKSNIYSLDEFLGPYPYHIYEKWKSLIRNVSDKLVVRVTPECGVIRSALDLVNQAPFGSSDKVPPSHTLPSHSCDEPATRSSSSMQQSNDVVLCPVRLRRKDLEESLLPRLEPSPGTQLRFTQVPQDLFPEGSTPADITTHSLDPTFTLDTLLATLDSEGEYVGEIELSFVCFLAGLCLDALETWKRLMRLACRCDQALTTRPNLYLGLLAAVSAQLELIPQDFLVDIVESENAVYMSLRNLFRSALTSDSVDPQLKKTVSALSQQLSDRFEWDFTNLEEEDEEDAPVVVNLDN